MCDHRKEREAKKDFEAVVKRYLMVNNIPEVLTSNQATRHCVTSPSGIRLCCCIYYAV